MTTFTTKQRAYVGKFALKTSDGSLLARPCDSRRPRLYDTEAQAASAGVSIRWDGPLAVVKLT